MFSLETVLALMAGGLLYWFPIRRWSKRWGATDVDLARCDGARRRCRS